MSPEIRLTPPRRAKRLMAGLVMPWMLSLNTLRWRLAPPFPSPFPPLPRPVMLIGYQWMMLSRWDSAGYKGLPANSGSASAWPPRIGTGILGQDRVRVTLVTFKQCGWELSSKSMHEISGTQFSWTKTDNQKSSFSLGWSEAQEPLSMTEFPPVSVTGCFGGGAWGGEGDTTHRALCISFFLE